MVNLYLPIDIISILDLNNFETNGTPYTDGSACNQRAKDLPGYITLQAC